MTATASLSRRHFLAATGTAAAGLAAAPFTRAQEADAERSEASGLHPTTQPGQNLQGAGFYRHRVGEVTITLLSDGTFPMDPSLFEANAEQGAVEQALRDQFVDPQSVPGHVNALLLQSSEFTLLVDTGCGSAFGPATGRLDEHLARCGVGPDQIDGLVLTHLHPDHFGGLTAGDSIQLPDARVVMSREEHDFWTGEPDLSGMSVPDEMKQSVTAGARQTVQRVRDRLELLPADQQIADGVDLIPLPGHTPGHVGLHISSGGDELLYITDAIHQPHIQLGQPQWHVAFDVAPDEAAVTRRRILQQAADNRTLIAGAHLPFPGLGHVEAVGEGFRLHPVIWQWSA